MPFQNPYGSTYELGTRTAADAVPAERLAFVRRVYSLFFLSLVAAFAGGFFAISTGAVLWFVRHPIIAFVLYIGGVFGVQGLSRKSGINVIALLAYAAFTGAYFSLIALVSYLVTGGKMDPATGALTGGSWHLAGQAFGLTLIVFGGLTLFAFVSRTDFSFLGGALFIGLLIFLGLGVIGMIWGFPSSGLQMAFLVGVVVIMAGYVLFDTSNIMRHYPTDASVSAALAIYIDFAILFVYLLQILIQIYGNRR
jgi:modulator of FtsH protease